MGHPAHVHHFKNMIRNLESKGHIVKICTTDKDVTLHLLDAFSFDYEILGVNRSRSIMAKAFLLFESEYRMLRIARHFKPDLFVSRGSPASAHTSMILRKAHIAFLDTDLANLKDMITTPFTSVICTPSCFKKDLGKKQVRYNGYKELAYLHPNCFQPDPSVLNELSLSESDKYFIVRFVSWGAIHDIGQQGLDQAAKRRLVAELKAFGRVLLTSESPLPDEFKQYGIPVPPERIHDLLYYAMMYIGEGATMATEAAVLGTPSIYISSLASTMGNFVELEEKYGMVFIFKDVEPAIGKVAKLLQQPNLKQDWAQKRERLLTDKIDVTKFMVDFVENYPRSFEKAKQRQVE